MSRSGSPQAGFTPLQTYKVLKPGLENVTISAVLHHYKLTRFSNGAWACPHGEEFYTITNLQGSQTGFGSIFGKITFYTITNLQGSQTEHQ